MINNYERDYKKIKSISQLKGGDHEKKLFLLVSF